MEEQDTSGESWQAWTPERVLRQFSPNEVRFSCGFLMCDLYELFSTLKAHWLPLFHALGSSIQIQHVEKGFDFPLSLRRQYVVEFDGEPALLALDTRAERSFAQAVVPSVQGSGAEVVLDYLERRLLSSLAKSWSGGETLSCVHTSVINPSDVEVVAAIHLQVLVDGVQCSCWFGLGSAAVERLDQIARQKRPLTTEAKMIPLDQEQILTVDIAELLVPPELLTDYLRPETIIGLDLPVRSDVIVRVNNTPWALGRLGQFRGKYALEILDFDPGVSDESAGNTKLRVEVARVKLQGKALRDIAHRGAILQTSSLVGAEASLVINGEQVGRALIGEIAGQFALNILEK